MTAPVISMQPSPSLQQYCIKPAYLLASLLISKSYEPITMVIIIRIPITRIQTLKMFLLIEENEYFSVPSVKHTGAVKAQTRTDLNGWDTGEPLYAPGPAKTPQAPPQCNRDLPVVSGDSSWDFLLAPALWGNTVLNPEGYKIIWERHGIDLSTLSSERSRVKNHLSANRLKQKNRDGKFLADLDIFSVFSSSFRSSEVIQWHLHR